MTRLFRALFRWRDHFAANKVGAMAGLFRRLLGWNVWRFRASEWSRFEK